jgi:hypothetical protein
VYPSMRIFTFTLAVVLLTSFGAHAQSFSQTGTVSNQDAQHRLSIREEVWDGPMGQQVKQRLEQAGFTDVTMLPSFVVISAKNAQGDPVNILIDFDARTAIELSGSDDDKTKAISPPRTANAAWRRE